MSILKNTMAEKFSQLPNELIEDTRISAKAFRVAAYLFSRPSGWQVKNADIMNRLGISDEGSLAKYWKELMVAGWVTRQKQAKGDNGKFNGAFDYCLNIAPVIAVDRVLPYPEKTQIRQNPVHSKTPYLNNTNIISNTKYINNTELNVVCEQTTPTPTKTKLQERLNCKNAKHESEVIEIVDYFNQVSGRKAEYQTAGALKWILYWLNEGHSVADFKAVIDYKTAEFRGTENEKYIALDTYCRREKFEDNLSKAKNQTVKAQKTENTLNDIELTQEQAAQYEASKAYILDHYPNLKEVRFFSHREFLLFSTNNNREFLPEFWKNKATERNMRQMKIDAMAKLNNNTFERKAAGSLYEYVKTHIRNELKKDN